MAQFARPATDISRGNWVTQNSGTTNLYQSIDEATASDTDYVASGADPSSDTYEVKLSSVTDPTSALNHINRVRAAKIGTATIDLTIALVQNTSVLASWSMTNLGTTATDGSYTLTGTEADSITDYTDLRLRFTANVSGGGGGGTVPVVAATNTTNDSGAANTFAANLPSGIAAGNLLMLGVGASGGSILTPSGWTLTGSSSVATNPHVYVFHRIADGSEGATVTVTKGASGVQNCGAVSLRITGHNATTPEDATAVAFGDALSTATSLTMDITTVTAHALVIGFVSVNSGSTLVTEPSGWTENAENSAGRIIEAASIEQATAGNRSGQWTWGAGRATSGVICAIRPA